eukprot:COSAG01_NODE_8331_length_2826_cov_1.515952_2_plen_91_part_00
MLLFGSCGADAGLMTAATAAAAGATMTGDGDHDDDDDDAYDGGDGRHGGGERDEPDAGCLPFRPPDFSDASFSAASRTPQIFLNSFYRVF